MEYLSELFLTELDNDFTEENVRKALKKCEKCFDEKAKGVVELTGVSQYLQGNFAKDRKREALYRELQDFWDVFAEFGRHKTYDFELVRMAAAMQET